MKWFTFACNIKLNTRIIIGIIIVTVGLFCVVAFKDTNYWVILASGIVCMVGGKLGDFSVTNGSNSAAGGGTDLPKDIK